MVQIRKDLPIPPKTKYAYLQDLEIGDCIIFDNWTEFERTRDAMRYLSIPYISRKVMTNQSTEYRLWRTQQ